MIDNLFLPFTLTDIVSLELLTGYNVQIKLGVHTSIPVYLQETNQVICPKILPHNDYKPFI